jgi:alkaline phosphatase D
MFESSSLSSPRPVMMVWRRKNKKRWIVFLLSWHAALFVVNASAEEHQTTRIAFGSCHKNQKATVPSIWERVVEEEPDAFVWTGDAMYSSHRDPVTRKKRYGPAPPHEIQQAFEEMKVNETIGYSKLLATQIPVYGTVDDHDFGGNDFGKYMPNKKERQEVFWKFLGYQPHNHEGIYHSIDIYEKNVPQSSTTDQEDTIKDKGQIKLILLDTRSFRDDHCIPSVAHKLPMGNAIACATRWATAGLNLWKYAKWWGMDGCEKAKILGEDQWKWLQNELLSSTADLNIIVSSVQIWTTNPAMESWGQFPKEQERLWNLMQQHYARSSSSSSVGPVLFWSGDVHHGEISGHEGYLEVTSSGLTHHCGQPKLYGRLCQPLLENFHQHRFRNDTFFIGLNYGVLQVDWQTRIATVQVKSAQGETVLQVEQPLDISNPNLPPYQGLPHAWDGHLIPWALRLLVAIIVAVAIAGGLLKTAT